MKNLFLLIALLGSIKVGYSQNTNLLLYDIALKFLINNGDLSKETKVRSTDMSYCVFDVNNKKYLDINTPIPVYDSLLNYRIFLFGPHTPSHLIYIKNGDWIIINMHKNLIEILEQGLWVCKQFDLTQDEVYGVFNNILEIYDFNKNNEGGVRIVQDSIPNFALRQIKNTKQSLREIARNWMIDLGELSKDTKFIPEYETIWMINEKTNEAPNNEVSISADKYLERYRIGILNQQSFQHLMFVKHGDWGIINMRKDLIDIIKQGISICERLGLSSEDTFVAFQDVLKYYTVNKGI